MVATAAGKSPYEVVTKEDCQRVVKKHDLKDNFRKARLLNGRIFLYTVTESGMSFYDANMYCQCSGGYLVTVANQEQQDALVREIHMRKNPLSGKSFWLGKLVVPYSQHESRVKWTFRSYQEAR